MFSAAVYPSIPIYNITKFIACAKANPGKINYASGGTGGSSHLSVEIFMTAAGFEMQHIGYKGNSVAYADVIGGRVPMNFAARGFVLRQIQTGSLRAIGVTFRSRSFEEARELTRRMHADIRDDAKAVALPLLKDRVFSLDEAAVVQPHMRANAHFGKIVLRM